MTLNDDVDDVGVMAMVMLMMVMKAVMIAVIVRMVVIVVSRNMIIKHSCHCEYPQA